MNNQLILRVCEMCHRIMDKDDNRTYKVWNGVDLASHGLCLVCERESERHGRDKYIDMTAKYRRR